MKPTSLKWRELVERYAICARELSDAAARLGEQDEVGPETIKLWKEIQELRDACLQATQEIDKHIEDEKGKWHVETAPGSDRPDTDVKDRV